MHRASTKTIATYSTLAEHNIYPHG